MSVIVGPYILHQIRDTFVFIIFIVLLRIKIPLIVVVVVILILIVIIVVVVVVKYPQLPLQCVAKVKKGSTEEIFIRLALPHVILFVNHAMNQVPHVSFLFIQKEARVHHDIS
jgi:hypothetical protein